MPTEYTDCGEAWDSVCIETFYGVTHREPFQFLEEDEDGVQTEQDISGWDLKIVVTEGPVEYPGATIHEFTIANGGIERDDGEAKFTMVMDDDVAEDIDIGKYSYRAELYITGETVPFEIPFRGEFHHRRSGR